MQRNRVIDIIRWKEGELPIEVVRLLQIAWGLVLLLSFVHATGSSRPSRVGEGDKQIRFSE